MATEESFNYPGNEGTSGILKSKDNGWNTSAKTEKSVRIVEPDCLHEIQVIRERNRILEKRLFVEELIERQIRKRKADFKQWMEESAYLRQWKLLRNAIISLPIIWLIMSVVEASVCHSYNSQCGVYWHESLVAEVFGCFVSSWHGPASF